VELIDEVGEVSVGEGVDDSVEEMGECRRGVEFESKLDESVDEGMVGRIDLGGNSVKETEDVFGFEVA
jgi:hypothetical protein